MKKQGYIIETRSVIGVESVAMGPWKERQGKEKESTEGIQSPVFKERRGLIANQS